jgi:glycosyltransferase involved in cell wall biosynthesis
MNILIVVLHRPTKPTGVCRHAANLALCLSDLNEVSEITVVTGSWQRDYFESGFSLLSDKINIIDIDIKNNSVSRNIWFLQGLPKLVNRLNPDLVHLTFPLPFLRSHISCPVVTTIHDLYAFDCPDNFGHIRAFFNRVFFRQCVKESDGLSCVSEDTKFRLLEIFPNSNHQKTIEVVYNYVNFDRIEPIIPDLLKDNPDQLFLLCVAQHRKNKNLNILIDAFAELKSMQVLPTSTLLLLVGSSGPETESLHFQVGKKKIKQSVFFLSALEDTNLQWLYQHCQLFVIPSSLEGFCIPLIEALYFSCKVVCSDIPIFREIGTSSCTYFDVERNSQKNLEAGISESLNSNKILGEDVISRFSKIKTANKYLEFYSQVLTNLSL